MYNIILSLRWLKSVRVNSRPLFLRTWVFGTYWLVDFSLFGGAESLVEGREHLFKKIEKNGKTSRAPRRTEVTKPTATDNGVSYAGPPMDPNDFLWLMTEEPHRSRRTAIMKAHPEVCFFPIPNRPTNELNCISGNETYGPHPYHEIRSSIRSLSSSCRRIPSPEYVPLVTHLLHYGVRRWCNSEP